MGISANEIIEKTPTEVINVSMNFATTGLIADSVVLSSPTASITPNDSTLTVSNVQVSGQNVLMSLEDGSLNVKYEVTITVNTDDDQILQGVGLIHVRGK